MLITVKVTAFPHMMRRELKGLKLNSCAASRKPLISETNWEKKKTSFRYGAQTSDSYQY